MPTEPLPTNPSIARSGSVTRERILDAALERFIKQGYAGTSLREIAADLGISKAALYYHFPGKEDIFLGLHKRVHGLTKEVTAVLEEPMDDAGWARLVDGLIGVAIRNRALLALQLREQDATQALHRPDAIAKHGPQESEDQLGAILRDESADPETRIRRLAALGSVVAAVFGAEALNGIPDATIERVLREVSLDVLRGHSEPGSGSPA